MTKCVLPWYNWTGWLGIKHQVTTTTTTSQISLLMRANFESFEMFFVFASSLKKRKRKKKKKKAFQSSEVRVLTMSLSCDNFSDKNQKIMSSVCVAGCGKDLLWPVSVWRMGLLWWVQPHWCLCAVCHLHAAQNHPECTDSEAETIPR